MLTADDPLLPPPDSWVTDPRDVPPGVDPLHHLAEAVSDYYNFNAIAISAFDQDGVAVIPPDEHVLDHVARAYDLVEEEVALVRPAADTVYLSPEPLPACDLCGAPGRYDTKLTLPSGQIAAGYACEHCLRDYGDQTLGAGHSTYMMTVDEFSPQVRQVVAELCRRLNRDPIWD